MAAADLAARASSGAKAGCAPGRRRHPQLVIVAVDPVEGGRYGFSADWWDGHVEKEVGGGYGRLLQSYGVHKTLREARMRGLRTSRSIEADGTVLLTLEGGVL